MALTIGTTPFSEHPAGSFDVQSPARPLLFWKPFPKRLRVVVDGERLVNSRRIVALHETGKMMRSCAPWADVRRGLLTAGETAAGGRLGALRSWSAGAGRPVATSLDTPMGAGSPTPPGASPRRWVTR